MVKQYLLSVVAAALLTSLVMTVLPNGKFRRIAGLVGSLYLILTVLSPIMGLDPDDLATAVSRLHIETQKLQTGVEVTNREIQGRLISDACRSYIWDKASGMGVELEVDIRLSEGGTYPHPVGVVLKGRISAGDRAILTRYIAENLGIEADRQEWIDE